MFHKWAFSSLFSRQAIEFAVELDTHQGDDGIFGIEEGSGVIPLVECLDAPGA